MTHHAQALAHLVEHFGVKPDQMTPARVRSYDQALSRLPVAVLEPMVQRAIDTRTPRWGDLPTVAELRADAEVCRLELVKALGDYGCASCEGTKGFIAVTHADGVRMERCNCFRRRQEQLAALGLGVAPIAALTAAEGRDWASHDEG